MDVGETPCPLCGSESRRLLFEATDTNLIGPGCFGVVRCRKCRLCYTSPRPSPEAIARWYPPDHFAAAMDEASQLAPETGGLQLLLDHLGSAEGRRSVLDAGRGVGNLLRVLQGQGWDVRGVDPSEYAVQAARMHLGDPVILGRLDSAGLPDSSYDAVVLTDVLEHLHRPPETLAHVRRVLKGARQDA